MSTISNKKTLMHGFFLIALVVAGYAFLSFINNKYQPSNVHGSSELRIAPKALENGDELLQRAKDKYPSILHGATAIYEVDKNPNLYEIETTGGSRYFTDGSLSFFASGDFYVSNLQINYGQYRHASSKLMEVVGTPSYKNPQRTVRQKTSLPEQALLPSQGELKTINEDLVAIKGDLAKQLKDLKAKTEKLKQKNLGNKAHKSATAKAVKKKGHINTVSYSTDGNKVAPAVVKERRKKIVSNIDKSLLLTYPAEGEQLDELFVFTDFTCPYCKQLHNNLDKLTANGITVHYLNFPRAMAADQSRDDVAKATAFVTDMMTWAWCSNDPIAAYDSLYTKGEVEPSTCPKPKDGKKSLRHHNPVEIQFNLGRLLEVNVTPAAITSNGDMLLGKQQILNYR